MRKFSLLLGALGGALGGYLLSNSKLREELKRAKDPEAAAKTLGRHLQRDGKRLAKEVKHFVESEDVQRNLSRAKKFATAKFTEAKRNVTTLVAQGTRKARRAVHK